MRDVVMTLLSLLSITWCVVYFIKYARSDIKDMLPESREERKS